MRSTSRWMALASITIGIYVVVFAVASFFVQVGLVAPLIAAGIILGAWHLFRSSRLRKTAILGIVLCAGGTAAFLSGHEVLKEKGKAAISRWSGYSSPAIRLTALDGSVVDLDRLRGKRVLLHVWATWCSPCIKEIEDINAFVGATSRDDVAVVGITWDDRTVLEPFMREHPIHYPVVSVSDGQLPAPYDDVKVIPVSFILDRKGTIQFVKHGPMSKEDLVSLVGHSGDFAGVPRRIVATDARPAPTPR